MILLRMRERGFEPLRFNPLDPKGIKRRNRHAPKARAIPCNPFIINGFPVFPVSAEIGEKRSYSERHRHNIVIKSACSEIDDRWTAHPCPRPAKGEPLHAVISHLTFSARILQCCDPTERSDVSLRLRSRTSKLAAVITCPRLLPASSIGGRPWSEVTVRPVSAG